MQLSVFRRLKYHNIFILLQREIKLDSSNKNSDEQAVMEFLLFISRIIKTQRTKAP